MQDSRIDQTPESTISHLPLPELRHKWAKVWGTKPHKYIGRKMLELSLAWKLREMRGEGHTAERQKRLDHLVTMYRRNPQCFDSKNAAIKPGTRLVRLYKGKRYNVFVRPDGFEYDERRYTSLSQIASEITGTRWNGWLFFGLKKENKA